MRRKFLFEKGMVDVTPFLFLAHNAQGLYTRISTAHRRIRAEHLLLKILVCCGFSGTTFLLQDG